jgi:hypothetical protein
VWATRVLYRPLFGEGHSLKYWISSSGAPGGTDAAKLGGTVAAGVGVALVDVPAGELHPAATATTTSTPTSGDGRVDVMPRIVHMLFSVVASEQSDQICHDLRRRLTDSDGADAHARVHRHVAWVPVDAPVRRYSRSPTGFLSRGYR